MNFNAISGKTDLRIDQEFTVIRLNIIKKEVWRKIDKIQFGYLLTNGSMITECLKSIQSAFMIDFR